MTFDLCNRCGTPGYTSEESMEFFDVIADEGPRSRLDPWLAGTLHTTLRCDHFADLRDEQARRAAQHDRILAFVRKWIPLASMVSIVVVLAGTTNQWPVIVWLLPAIAPAAMAAVGSAAALSRRHR